MLKAHTTDCPVGFDDSYCETAIDKCASMPYRNGAICIDGHPAVSCHYFRQACDYLPSRRASPPLGRYHVILLGTEAHRCEQLAQGHYATFAASRIWTHDLLIALSIVLPLNILLKCDAGVGPRSVWRWTTVIVWVSVSQATQLPSSIHNHCAEDSTTLWYQSQQLRVRWHSMHRHQRCSPWDHSLGLEAPRGQRIKSCSWSWDSVLVSVLVWQSAAGSDSDRDSDSEMCNMRLRLSVVQHCSFWVVLN